MVIDTLPVLASNMVLRASSLCMMTGSKSCLVSLGDGRLMIQS